MHSLPPHFSSFSSPFFLFSPFDCRIERIRREVERRITVSGTRESHLIEGSTALDSDGRGRMPPPPTLSLALSDSISLHSLLFSTRVPQGLIFLFFFFSLLLLFSDISLTFSWGYCLSFYFRSQDLASCSRRLAWGPDYLSIIPRQPMKPVSPSLYQVCANCIIINKRRICSFYFKNLKKK